VPTYASSASPSHAWLASVESGGLPRPLQSRLRRGVSACLRGLLALWYARDMFQCSEGRLRSLLVERRLHATNTEPQPVTNAAPGLINNVLYVIILSAALDLVGPSVPKGVVLLCDVIPSFLTKLCAPYFIHKIPYSVRILVFVALSACGMFIIALTPPLQDSRSIAIKMCGVMLASLSSGGGELSFLGLTHYYGHFALAAWGSGTGGAGLIGAGAYAIATNTLQINPRTSLLVFAFLPLIMVFSFFVILPLGPLRAGTAKNGGYEAIDNEEDEPVDETSEQEQDRLLSSSVHSTSGQSTSPTQAKATSGALNGFKANLNRARGLFFP
jgi:battenin